MYPSYYFNVNQSHHRLAGAGLCSFWVPAHNRLRQCYNILFGGVSGMMSRKGHYSPHRCTYHPATSGVAEHLVQTFKQALVKSSLPPKTALQEFLMQYRRTPLAVGYSPSEFLNGRQIRSKIGILLPSPAHIF